MDYRTFRGWTVDITTLLSVLFNSTLIFIILRTRSHVDARYSYLLQSFAAVGMSFSLSNYFFEMIAIISSIGPIGMSLRTLEMGEAMGVMGCLVPPFILCTITLLPCFQFVYLYCTVCNPPNLRWLSESAPRAIALMAVTVAGCGISFFAALSHLMPNERTRAGFAGIFRKFTGRDINADPIPGYIAAYNDVMFGPDGMMFTIKFSLFMVPVSACIAISIYCAIKIFGSVRNVTWSDGNTSKRSMLKQLFLALLAESAIPIVLAYGPLLIIYSVFIIGWDVEDITDKFYLASTLFPVLEPIAITACIPPYRARVYNVWAHLRGNEHIIVTSLFRSG